MIYTLTAPVPASGNVNAASGNFTVTLGTGDPGGSVVITPATTAGKGTFSPTTVTLSNTTRTATFTFTPTSPGVWPVATTNNSTLTDPGPLTFTAYAQATSLETLIKNISGRTLQLSFLPPHGRELAAGATYALPGDPSTLIRMRWNDRDFFDLYRALREGLIEIIATPSPIVRDSVTGAVKQFGLANGSLSANNPSWGAYTDS